MAKQGGILGSIIETIKTLVYALLIAGIFRTLLFQAFWIPSGSMKDTLLIGDFMFVNKMSYGYSYASCPSVVIPALGIDLGADDFCGFFEDKEERLFGSEPEQGDVVVFRHPVTGRDFIKRIVGVAGDRVQMIDGLLHINDVPVKIEDGGTFVEKMQYQGPQRNLPRCANGAVGQGAVCIKTRKFETLPNGTRHAILDIGPQRLDNTGIFTVPEKHFFFMGDNRDNSTDSRVAQTARGVGFVHQKDLVGRADRVMFSSAGSSMLAFWTWRGDRFFKAIE